MAEGWEQSEVTLPEAQFNWALLCWQASICSDE